VCLPPFVTSLFARVLSGDGVCWRFELCNDRKRDIFSATSEVMGSLSFNLNLKNPIDFETCELYVFETDAGHKVKVNGMLIK